MDPYIVEGRTLTLLVSLARVMPSELAVGLAGLEWQAVRRAWLQALDAHGVNEADVRAVAARTWGEVVVGRPVAGRGPR